MPEHHRPTIVILDGYTINPGDNPWDPVAELGELVVYDRTPAREVISRAREADILLTSKVELDEQVLSALPRLKFVSLLATGYNHIDTEAAGRLGIPVSNVPAYSTPSVAQFTMALLLGLCHRVELHDRAVHQGEWAAQEDFCFWKTTQIELDGKTFGIVGFGDIGQKVGELAHALGMNVLAYNPRPKNRPKYDPFAFADIEELFARSDVVSLHCPLTHDNEQFVDSALLDLMKPSAFLLNTARGGLIREYDLVRALKQGIIAGAALDVVAREPLPEESPLLTAPNLLITPHMAWGSLAARSRLTRQTASNIQAFLEGSPINLVNAGHPGTGS
ncbi:MAG: D-2-hydroxyacid dehydrogenase [Desulfovibrionales bacterium]